MKIVSGKTGSPHVTSHEFRQIIEGAIGQGSCILSSGDNLEPELVTNNLLKIKSGMMSHHGNVSSVENYDEVELTNGTQGMKRIDLIVNRYTRDDETKVEDNSWVCIIGTPHASSPEVPSYTVGSLQDGDLIDECPVFQIFYDGINVTEVKKLLAVSQNNIEMQESLSKLEKAGWHRLKREGFPGSSGSVTWDMNWDENEPQMFMLVLGSCPSPASSATEKDYNRRLCTTIIPRDNAIETIGVDKSNGAHQAYYNGTISGGISFLSKSQVKAYYSGEVLIELMAWY